MSRVSKRVSRPKAKVPGRRAVGTFGAAYFRRFYLDPATRVVTSAEMRTRAQLIAAVLAHAEIPIRSILDAGCGVGLLRKPFAQVLPRARYVGLDASPYLCKRYGWVQGSIAEYAPRQPSDLVVCYDVLQYLDDREAARAMANLGRLAHAALYFSALTREDWRQNCDRTRTDRAVRLRSGDWYRRHLKRQFRYLGFGVWLRKGVSAILWDLEGPR
jgi:trans-aconitate methyltransferase